MKQAPVKHIPVQPKTSKQAIAIIGLACEYPDANTPEILWENALAGRRSFRRIPAERLRLEDYQPGVVSETDSIYLTQAALVQGYAFDRVAFKVSASLYESADLTHWLALDVAARALEDAQVLEADDSTRENTGVIVGNSLTGESSRASALRLRWPYMRRVLNERLRHEGWTEWKRREFLSRTEELYKKPFHKFGEDSLSGGLSNTIAGRICNHFDFGGGGYTVDGACSSSLLALTDACRMIAAGELEMALAGGVDISLDPFELVGFSRLGALARDEMRVYDHQPTGFWPGEGCGFVALMDYERARKEGRKVYAVIRGWGVSSDGGGGLTRPEIVGQTRALSRAYSMAGYGFETVGYVEGHGTGTVIGDEVELRTLAQFRQAADRGSLPTAIGSIKANIGHTKAAAGIAGMLKTVMALHRQIIPPMTGATNPHPVALENAESIYLPRNGEDWPEGVPLRAGVSSMGFGGINVHIALENPEPLISARRSVSENQALRSAQDCELFFFSADTAEELETKLLEASAVASSLSRGELGDLSSLLMRELMAPDDKDEAPTVSKFRAALVAGTADEFATNLQKLIDGLSEDSSATIVDDSASIFAGSLDNQPEIMFLFPGQGSPTQLDGGLIRRRFPNNCDPVYQWAQLPEKGDRVATEIAQPAITAASLSALEILSEVGISASTAVGHSLGELTALHWGGAFSSEELLELARIRGQVMANCDGQNGAMASLRMGEKEARDFISGLDLSIAGLNTPTNTVVSGPSEQVNKALERVRSQGLAATPLPVSHAFHSALVSPAAEELSSSLKRFSGRLLARNVFSTVTGSLLSSDSDIPKILFRQVTSPVLFQQAFSAAAKNADLIIEVGPGRNLSGMAKTLSNTAVIATDSGGETLRGLFNAIAGAFALGAPLKLQTLYEERLTHKFALDRPQIFFTNPCEKAPVDDDQPDNITEPLEKGATGPGENEEEQDGDGALQSIVESGASSLEVMRALVARHVELPLESIASDSRLLVDLHLNSITVGQIVSEACVVLRLPAPAAPTEFATATVAEVAMALSEMKEADQGGHSTLTGSAGLAGPAGLEGLANPGSLLSQTPFGVDTWVRRFTALQVEHHLSSSPRNEQAGKWQVTASDNYQDFAEQLKTLLDTKRCGSGVVVCLNEEVADAQLESLLRVSQQILTQTGTYQFVVIQTEEFASSFGKTLWLEAQSLPLDLTVKLVTIPSSLAESQRLELTLAEIVHGDGFVEALYDQNAVRHKLELILSENEDNTASSNTLNSDDVVLITGGGRGIAAECALQLGREQGVSLGIIGRSDPQTNSELADNLKRLREHGVTFHYAQADVCQAVAVTIAVKEIEEALGTITFFLHGAGLNHPRLIGALTAETMRQTIGVKVDGLRNVLAALDPAKLKTLVTFGSIISRSGLRGEADYALANEQLRRLTERHGKEHIHCRCLCLEWSIWSGVGMGERLGRIEALLREGVTPISVDQGLSMFQRLISNSAISGPQIITGRFGETPTLSLPEIELPSGRFLETPRLHYPGLELVVDCCLSVGSDPYLQDHIFEGRRILPAVMTLEAFCQVASATINSSTDSPARKPVQFENVLFQLPVTVPDTGATTIRISALKREDGSLDLTLRSSETDFQIIHASARAYFDNEKYQPFCTSEYEYKVSDYGSETAPAPEVNVDLFYSEQLFQRGRFRRITNYSELAARLCVSTVSARENSSWFDEFHDQNLLLGDPGARDAAIHSIQACVPQAALLPVAVRLIRLGEISDQDKVEVRACEVERNGSVYTYNMQIVSADGQTLESWEGLQLKVVNNKLEVVPKQVGLLAPYLERLAPELIPGFTPRVSLARSAVVSARSDILYRPDGKPEMTNGSAIGRAHDGDLLLTLVSPDKTNGTSALACDMETVAPKNESVWKDLLGAQRYKMAKVLSRRRGEDFNSAATRVWSALECARKMGEGTQAPLTAIETSQNNWVILTCGDLMIASLALTLDQETNPRIISLAGYRQK